MKVYNNLFRRKRQSLGRGQGELSLFEVVGFLLGSQSHHGSVVLCHLLSESLGFLLSQVKRSVLLILELRSGFVDSLLTDHCQTLGDCFPDELTIFKKQCYLL